MTSVKRVFYRGCMLLIVGVLLSVIAVSAQEATPEVTDMPMENMNMATADAMAAMTDMPMDMSAMATAEMTDMPMMMAMPNPDNQAILDQLAAFEPLPLPEISPRIAREQPSFADAVIAELANRGEGYIPEAVADVTHRVIPGADPNEDLLVRIYMPEGDGPFPVVVYYHGGGFVIATINTYDSSARALTNAAGAIVVSVAYRQAPEFPFPAAVEDSYAAFNWVVENAASFNGDPARVAVAGESAGGNAATVVSLMARDRGTTMPIYQVLIYPLVQWVDTNTLSYQQNADAAPLSRAAAIWFTNYYLPNEADRSNPYASPLLADDLSGLPPATIITAEIDPLRSEGEQYAVRLSEVGVLTVYQAYDNVTHEFFGAGTIIEEARQAVALAAEGLRGAFGN